MRFEHWRRGTGAIRAIVVQFRQVQISLSHTLYMCTSRCSWLLVLGGHGSDGFGCGFLGIGLLIWVLGVMIWVWDLGSGDG